VSDGIKITVTADSLDDALRRLIPILHLDEDELLSSIGAIGESQTRRRITDEKTAPDGTAWAPNHKGTSILLETGNHLLGTIGWVQGADEVEWGSYWEYAHVHQEGAVIKPINAKALAIPGSAFGRPLGDTVLVKKAVIPARPFIGLSDDNREEILDIVSDVWGLLQ